MALQSVFWFLVHLVLYGTDGFRDETLAGYADRSAIYRLEEMQGHTDLATTTLTFPRIKKLRVRTPCFRYEAKIVVPYPWFQLAAIQSKEYGCIVTPVEQIFRDQLMRSTLAETQNGILILTTDQGEALVFRAQP